MWLWQGWDIWTKETGVGEAGIGSVAIVDIYVGCVGFIRAFRSMQKDTGVIPKTISSIWSDFGKKEITLQNRKFEQN